MGSLGFRYVVGNLGFRYFSAFGFRVWGLGFIWVQDFGARGLGIWVQAFGFRDSGFGVWDVGVRV